MAEGEGAVKGDPRPADPHALSLSDPVRVRAQYATEKNLAAGKSIYGETTGPDARLVLFGAIAKASARDVLELGCGEGELAARVAETLGATK